LDMVIALGVIAVVLPATADTRTALALSVFAPGVHGFATDQDPLPPLVIVPLIVAPPAASVPLYCAPDEVVVSVTLPLDSVPLYSAGVPVGGATTRYIFDPLTSAPSVAVGATVAVAPADWVPQYKVACMPVAWMNVARLSVWPNAVQVPEAPVDVKTIVHVAGGEALVTVTVLSLREPVSVIDCPPDVVNVTVTVVEPESAKRIGALTRSPDEAWATVIVAVPLVVPPSMIPW
jgi:hypothetical protein